MVILLEVGTDTYQVTKQQIQRLTKGTENLRKQKDCSQNLQ